MFRKISDVHSRRNANSACLTNGIDGFTNDLLNFGWLPVIPEGFLNESGKIHDRNSQTASGYTSTTHKRTPSAQELCGMNRNIFGPFPPISDTFVEEQSRNPFSFGLIAVCSKTSPVIPSLISETRERLVLPRQRPLEGEAGTNQNNKTASSFCVLYSLTMQVFSPSICSVNFSYSSVLFIILQYVYIYSC